MDPYDSDSSLDDEGDFTETGVLLGYAAEEIIEDTISHLGGWPTWIDDASPPPGDLANCKVCNRPMLLLLELHGDLPEHFPNDERRLYIFGCPRKACNRKPGSIRALRATRKVNEESGQPQKQHDEENKHSQSAAENNSDSRTVDEKSKQDLGASLFGATSLTSNASSNPNPFSSSSTGSNPFSTPISAGDKSGDSNSSTSASANALAETFADKVRVSSPPPTANTAKPTPESAGPPTPWPAQSDFPAPYRQFYLDAEYETLSRPSTPKIPENVTMEPMDEEGGGSGAELKDTFESELDKAFMKFSNRLAHNPEQVLRYEFRGTPLLYSHTDPVGRRLHQDHSSDTARVTTTPAGGGSLPPCEYCGSERVFELQLVPHAISVLEEGREGVGLGKNDAGMEWGTIILGVCARDCAPQLHGRTGWREEWAGVQWEETR